MRRQTRMLNTHANAWALHLLLILILAPIALSTRTRALDMTQWKEGNNVDWDKYPVWHAERQLDLFDPKTLDYQQVLDYANEYYNGVKDKEKCLTATGPCMVAVLYDAGARRLFASTVPRGLRKDFMIRKKQSAPLWYQQVQNLHSTKSGDDSRNTFHAEDGAFFNFETTKGADVSGGRYPQGSIVAVWGRFPSEDSKGHEIELCGKAALRDPSCQVVASALGVSFGSPSGLTAQQNQEDNDESLYEPTSDEEQLMMEQNMLCDSHNNERVARRGKKFVRDTNGYCSEPALPSAFSPIKDTNSTASAPITSSTASRSSRASSRTSTRKSSSTRTTPSSITHAPTPTPSCYMRNQDPDQGINSAYCVCGNSVTLPLLSAPSTAMATESCHYTSIPRSAQITPKASLGPATTNKKMCQICTPVVNNEDSCTTMSSCIVQTAAVTVQAGSSPVHVGTVTGTALYTGVSKALETLCPSVSQSTSMTACSTGTVKIPGIAHVSGGSLEHGELVVRVESSQYNQTSLRDAMIKSAALTAQNAAVGKNCYNQTYTETIYKKRSLPSSIFAREAPPPITEERTVMLCNSVGFAGVNYYNPYWRVQASPGASDWIDARWDFEMPPQNNFICDLLRDFIDAFAVVQPEFAVEDVELGEAIDVVCQDSMDEN